jgi:DNA-binding CsgD family transcriptional regulator
VRKLTEIQLKILRCLASGMSSMDISDQTMTNPSSTRAHIGRILKKARCRSIFQLGAWAERNGLLEPSSNARADAVAREATEAGL